MHYTDLHTHSHTAGATAIVNDGNAPQHSDGLLRSAGVHPWEILPCPDEQIAAVERAATLDCVVAIGECGIDKIKSTTNLEVQKKVFEAHALIAEETGKPLIIHCVKAQEEIIAIKRSIQPRVAWIIHGFRGKPTQAAQLLKEGFYLSYGEHYNAASLIATPLCRLFIESDTSLLTIEEIYEKAAATLGTSVEKLAAQTLKNFVQCGIRTDKAL